MALEGFPRLEALHRLALHQVAPRRGLLALHQVAPRHVLALHQVALRRGLALHQVAPRHVLALHQVAPRHVLALHHVAPRHVLARVRGDVQRLLPPARVLAWLHQHTPAWLIAPLICRQTLS